ncbi:MAG: Ser-Thr-rich GPI-anchored membrane family protein [Candidatus Cyclobacteriaceae bacterium M2_1C_046]
MRIYIKYFLLLLLSAVFLNANSQTLTNIRAEAKGEVVIINYDLIAPQSDQKFDVKLYASHNNYSSPLKFVSGDVGENVQPGTNKRIQWDAKAELQKFDGNITFEVRATTAMPAVSFTNPTKGTKFKRGKTYPIVWEGGSASKEYELELYRNGVKQQTIGTVEDNQRFTWAIPIKVDNAKNYTIKLVDGNQPVAESQPFTIKRKVPLGLKIIPIVAVGVGAGVYFMLNSITTTPPPVIEEDPLPEAPSAPTGG